MLNQIAVFVENEPGSLMRVTSALKEEQINIRAFAAVDTPEFGILRIVVDDPVKAKDSLTHKGFVVKVCKVMALELDDRTGSFNEVLEYLANANITVNYVYSFVVRETNRPLIIMNTDNMDIAEQMLSNHGVQVVDSLEA